MLRRSISTRRRPRRDHSPSSQVESSSSIKPGLLRGRVEAWTKLVARYRRDTAPAVLQHGIYQQLDPSQDQIRILTVLPSSHPDSTVCCTISTLTLEAASAQGYDALSYCWGAPSPAAETRTVLVNDVLRDVTTSLEAALRGLRSPSRPVRLWADALCINQSDTRERNHQVQLMQKIYRLASTVRVSLHHRPNPHTRPPHHSSSSSSNPSPCPRLDMIEADPDLLPRSLRLIAALKAQRTRWQRKNAYAPVTAAVDASSAGGQMRPATPWSDTASWVPFGTLLSAHEQEQLQQAVATITTASAPPAATLEHRLLGLSESDVLDLVAFFSHPWWTRIWVVQEVHLARECVVHAAVGEENQEGVRFPDVMRAAERLWDVLDSLESTGSELFSDGEGRGVAGLKARTASARAFLRILAVCRVGSPGETGSLVEILAGARALMATDPRDQVLGLIGLSPLLQGVEPDYAIAAEMVFVRAAGEMVRSTQSLDVLFLAGLQINRLATPPSWVPDWTVREGGQGLRHVAVRNLYSAAGMSRASFAVRKSGGLGVKGIMVDVVEETTDWSACEDGSEHLHTLLSSIIRHSSRLRQPIKHRSESVKPTAADTLAGMRTVAMDVVRSGGPLQRGFDSAMKYYGLDDDDEDKRAILEGSAHVVIEMDESKEPRSMGRFLKDELAPNVRGQHLCNTKAGRLCLLPDSSQPGDTIQLIAGLSMPAVLRPCGQSKFQLVGVCYLDGLMDNTSVGTALQIGDSSKLHQFKTIIII